MCSAALCLLLTWCLLGITSGHFFIINPGFGDSEENEQEFLARCQQKCSGSEKLDVARCFFMHPKACNMFMQCLRFTDTWFLISGITERGKLFNERTGSPELAFEQFERIPILNVCINGLHPCETMKPIPVNGQHCGGYKMCENGSLVEYRCPEGKGFSAMSGQCDLECNVSKRRILKTKCGPSPRGKNYFQFNETVVYGDAKLPEVEALDTPCPAYTSYQTMGKCGCDPYEVTVAPCKNQTVINLSSSDDSWEMAKSGSPLEGSGTIIGEARVVDQSDRRFGGSARFEEGFYFISNWLIQNDLGLYFDILFTFQVMRNGRNGYPLTSDDRAPVSVALVDNSANEYNATYGCMLKVERSDSGRIVCYVTPSNAMGSDRQDVIGESDLVDLRRKISVQFAKNDRKGKLFVRVEGQKPSIKSIRFPLHARAIGNLSPLIIGAGKEKRPFNGYMDDMFIRKYCDSFMDD